jgi:hypothetical protein
MATISFPLRSPAAFALALLLKALALPAAAFDCQDLGFHWSNDQPAVNRVHVFCGEIRNGRPKGFHSLRLLGTSAVVTRVTGRSNERDGIYDASVRFRNDTAKFSTFFPDACTVDQVVASIHYAATHVERDHPQWGKLGPSAPEQAQENDGYCRNDGGDPFEIRIGLLADGRVNTAFPN